MGTHTTNLLICLAHKEQITWVIVMEKTPSNCVESWRVPVSKTLTNRHQKSKTMSFLILSVVSGNFTLIHISSARVDGLVKREETPSGMTEYFEDRVDFLCYRHVVFGKRVKKFGPQESSNRPIQVIFENVRKVYILQRSN